MNKTMTNQVFELICKNPSISNKEIDEVLNTRGNAKTFIFRLKEKGLIDQDVDADGNRIFKINTLENNDAFVNNKSTLYQEMIDAYMFDFIRAETFDDRLKVGRELRLLIEKL